MDKARLKWKALCAYVGLFGWSYHASHGCEQTLRNYIHFADIVASMFCVFLFSIPGGSIFIYIG